MKWNIQTRVYTSFILIKDKSSSLSLSPPPILPIFLPFEPIREIRRRREIQIAMAKWKNNYAIND